MSRHLWECEHSYYCSTKNYYCNESTCSFKCLEDFLASEGDADMDYNLLFRWDWLEEDEKTGECNYNGDNYYRNGELRLFFMGQRKGLYRSACVQVCRADEPKIVEYLRPRWEYMQRLWEPFALPREVNV